MTWYLQSMSNHDTHRGALCRGTVLAECGITFRPSKAVRPDPALRGNPPDPDQICPQCDRANDAR